MSKAKNRLKLPPSVKKHADVLCILAKARPKLVKQIIANAEPSLLKSISECSLNILKGVIPLTNNQKRKLRRYKNAMRQLIKKRSINRKKKALMMKGGFIGALLGTIAPILISSLIGAAQR